MTIRSFWYDIEKSEKEKNILTKAVQREALSLLLTRFIVFGSGNTEIRPLNPSQPPRGRAATGHATQADKRDASAGLLSTSQINKIRPWCAQTHSPRAKWCNTVLKKFLFFQCGMFFFSFSPGIHSLQWPKKAHPCLFFGFENLMSHTAF